MYKLQNVGQEIITVRLMDDTIGTTEEIFYLKDFIFINLVDINGNKITRYGQVIEILE